MTQGRYTHAFPALAGSEVAAGKRDTSPIEENPGFRAIYIVNRGLVCDRKFIKITILMETVFEREPSLVTGPSKRGNKNPKDFLDRGPGETEFKIVGNPL